MFFLSGLGFGGDKLGLGESKRVCYIKIQIQKISDGSVYPVWVEFLFVDAWGNRHKFNEKASIVSCKNIDLENDFPLDGFIRCELLNEWTDDNGRRIATVSTEKTDNVETLSGMSRFDLLRDEVIMIDV